MESLHDLYKQLIYLKKMLGIQKEKTQTYQRLLKVENDRKHNTLKKLAQEDKEKAEEIEIEIRELRRKIEDLKSYNIYLKKEKNSKFKKRFSAFKDSLAISVSILLIPIVLGLEIPLALIVILFLIFMGGAYVKRHDMYRVIDNSLEEKMIENAAQIESFLQRIKQLSMKYDKITLQDNDIYTDVLLISQKLQLQINDSKQAEREIKTLIKDIIGDALMQIESNQAAFSEDAVQILELPETKEMIGTLKHLNTPKKLANKNS